MLSLAESAELARRATKSALQHMNKTIDENVSKGLVLGSALIDSNAVFELYVPAPRPEDAKVLVETTIDRNTGEASVEILF